LAHALIHFVLPKTPGPVWEFAAGDGRLAGAMRDGGRDVLTTDLHPRSAGVARCDFLRQPPPEQGRIAITNAPFNVLDRSIARGLSLLDSGAIDGLLLLVRHDALTAASRADASNRATALWACAWRPAGSSRQLAPAGGRMTGCIGGRAWSAADALHQADGIAAIRAAAVREDPTMPMMKTERDDLVRLIRRHEKVAKTAAAQRAAELRADFELQLDAQYHFDQDTVWREAMRAAKQATDDAARVIEERCAELGIPARFAPSIGLHWYSRGENAVKERRTELRRIAHERIAAKEKATCTEIERASVRLQTEVIAHGLASDEARAFLERLPTPDALMQPIEVATVERLLEEKRADRRHAYIGQDTG
jgi:hypothetical protein